MREKKGLTQKQLAKELKVSVAQVYRWENKKSHPSEDNVNKITKYFKKKEGVNLKVVEKVQGEEVEVVETKVNKKLQELNERKEKLLKEIQEVEDQLAKINLAYEVLKTL